MPGSEREQIEQAADAEVDCQRCYRELHCGLRAEAFANHIHQQEGDPAEGESAVEGQPAGGEQFLVGEQVHGDYAQEEERHHY